MPNQDVARSRLRAQGIAPTRFNSPAEVVTAMGAVQAQDYLGGLWAVALRTADATQPDVEQAVVDRQIVRTWPMRYTLHFVPAQDIRWMLALTAPRGIAKAAGRHRQLELESATFKKARQLVERALTKAATITRSEFYGVLARGGIDPSGQRGPHILGRLAHDGVVCFGPRHGAQQTIVLLDAWLPKTRTLSHDESLAEIARRYFGSHGPATDRDFAWWTGLTLTEARRAIDIVSSGLIEHRIDDQTYWLEREASTRERFVSPDVRLLPPWDEYLVGYTDRRHVLPANHASDWDPGLRGLGTPTIMIDGHVAGIWRRAIDKQRVTIAFDCFRALTKRERSALHDAAERYGVFLGLPVRIRDAAT